jgi:hypothetical protein
MIDLSITERNEVESPASGKFQAQMQRGSRSIVHDWFKVQELLTTNIRLVKPKERSRRMGRSVWERWKRSAASWVGGWRKISVTKSADCAC